MIKLTSLITEIIDPIESLDTFLKRILSHGPSDNIDIKISQSGNVYNVIINNKVKLDAEMATTSSTRINKWVLYYKGESVEVMHSEMRGYQNNNQWLLDSIIDDINNNTQVIKKQSVTDVETDANEILKIVNSIKNIIKSHPWDYEYTDAHNTYSKGYKNINNIRNLYIKLPDEYRNQIFEYWNLKSPERYKYKDFESFDSYFSQQ